MWTKIFINKQSIQSETDRSVLIKMPNRSDYSGWVFWFPRKLVRVQGGKGYHLSISFTEEFNFNLKKYGKGKYNRNEVIEELEISSDDMLEAFGVSSDAVSSSVKNEQVKRKENETVISTEFITPEKIEPVGNNTIKDLKR